MCECNRIDVSSTKTQGMVSLLALKSQTANNV